jgi:hypothetical protein
MSEEGTRYKCPKCNNEVFWLVKQGNLREVTKEGKKDLEWERVEKVAVCNLCKLSTGIKPSKPSKEEEDD